ncbi:MAG: hypothetical protein HKN48_05130 [Flavobacteriaceae bacterium]|nr:hypothetical protein [Flavobacteriaceae bacterium]
MGIKKCNWEGIGFIFLLKNATAIAINFHTLSRLESMVDATLKFIGISVNQSSEINMKSKLLKSRHMAFKINSILGQRISHIEKGIDLLNSNSKTQIMEFITSALLIGEEFNYLLKKLYISANSATSENRLLVSPFQMGHDMRSICHRINQIN